MEAYEQQRFWQACGLLPRALRTAALSLPPPEQAIVDMYKVLAPWADEIWKGILTFNVPLTLGKGILDSALTFLLYKHLSPILKGKV